MQRIFFIVAAVAALALPARCETAAELAARYKAEGKSLGEADANGNFILTPEGERVAALEEKERAAKPADALNGWGSEPLGAAGGMSPLRSFRNAAEFKLASAPKAAFTLVSSAVTPQIEFAVGSEAARRLAGEFAWHLSEMCSREIPAGVRTGGPRVVFGDAAAAREFGVDLSALPPETAVVRTRGNSVFIGGNGAGQSHALTAVLEALDCRYLWPGRLGKVIPRRERVDMPEMDLLQTPGLKVRRIRVTTTDTPGGRFTKSVERLGFDGVALEKATAAARIDHAGNRDFFAWHGVNDESLFAEWPATQAQTWKWGHSFGDYAERFGASHPEWFALQGNGSRRVVDNRPAFCLSNTSFADQAAADLVAEFGRHPEMECLSVCLQDGGKATPCLCPKCRAWDPANAPKCALPVFVPRRGNLVYVSLSDRVLRFSNEVQRRVSAACPGKRLAMYVYSCYTEPPVAEKPDGSLVLLSVAGDYATARGRDEATRILAGWSRFGNPMLWRPNAFLGFQTAAPQNFARRVFEDLEAMKANGLAGTDLCCMDDQWALKGLIYYAAAKAHLNYARACYEDLVLDYCRAGFGAAAGDVADYFAALERMTDCAAEIGGKEKGLLAALDDKVLAGFLDRAAGHAKGDAAVAARVAFLRTGLDCLAWQRRLQPLYLADDPGLAEAQKGFMAFLRGVAAKNPLAAHPRYTGYYDRYLKTPRGAPSAGGAPSVEWENQRVTSRNRLPARAEGLPDARFVMSLNGEWRFRWSPTPESRPQGFERTEYDAAAWGTIDVPSCVEMRGWGIPLYVHVGYPFPKRPPFVNHADNPVSSYRRTFAVPHGWQGRRVVLRFEGVASAFYAWVNGRRVGYSEDSFGISEFDITDFVHPGGDNLLAVEVYRWSDGSYIEDQDMFRFSGIFRDVKLWSMPKDGIWDFRASGKLKVESGECKEASISIEGIDGDWNAALYDADRKLVANFNSKLPTFNFPLSSLPRLWSAEDPYLYTLVVRRGDDERCQRIGFREVKIEGGRFLVNGRRVVMRGVNRHASEPANGWTVTDARSEADIVMMKRHNIDTVRTSHHPDSARFYDLCDRYGVYVVAEANVEAHGLGSHGANCVGTLPGWDVPIVERNVGNARRLRNHPCVVMWSLGNESGPGPAFAAACDAVKALDPTRPVHYECDESVSDVRSVMYPGVETVRRHANDADKPYFLCEYAHAMGNALGNFDEYMDAMLSGPSTCGGCVWDWSDQAVWKQSDRPGPDGSPARFLAYGGDWGEKADGSYCCNGLVDPLRRFSPKLEQVAHVYRRLVVVRTDGGFELENRHAFTSTDAFDGRWDVVEDGDVVRSGAFEVPRAGPGERCPIPSLSEVVSALGDSSKERFLNVSFAIRKSTPWAERGFVVARDQIPLGEPAALPFHAPGHSCRDVVAAETDGEVRVECGAFLAVFDRREGTLTSLALDGRPVLAAVSDAGPRLDVARAYTDNDIYLRQRHKRSPKGIPTFRESGLERLAADVGSVALERLGDGSARVVCDVVMKGEGTAGFRHVSTWTFGRDGRIAVENAVDPFGEMPILMRVGTRWRIDAAFERMSWYGRGPHENYVDRKTSAFFGRYESTVSEQYVDYVRPQDCGSKSDVRWVALTDATGRGVRFTCDRPLFVQALHYSREDLDGARHWKDEPARNAMPRPRPEVCLNLDVRQLGLGNASCGPRPLDKYFVEARPERWTLYIMPCRTGEP